MLVAIQKLKGDIEEAKFTNGDSDEMSKVGESRS
jgi:hypothetical protein